MDDDVRCEFLDFIAPDFQYSPVQPRWIRILDLLSKPDGDESLRCRLRHVKLESPETNYIALSYVWGCDLKPFQMHCLSESAPGLATTTSTGGTIPLTKSLFNALRDLRDCDEVQPKTFWIDQICIDQGNDDEKGHQVSQMGKVFQYATRVWTYLGPQGPRDDEGFNLLARIYAHFEPLRRTCLASLLLEKDILLNQDAKQMYRRMPMTSIPSGLLFEQDLFEDEHLDLFNQMDMIISGPWVERLWLLQENILNDSMTFLRGRRTLSWERMELVCQVAFIGLIPWLDATQNILRLVGYRFAWRQQNRAAMEQRQFHLRNLLYGTVGLECRDSRDKLYAILGIAADADDLNIHADYTVSAAQAFTNVSVAFIRHSLQIEEGDILRFEALSRDVSLDKSYSHMPTWVPTHVDSGYFAPSRGGPNASQTTRRHTSWDLASLINFESSPDVENGVLVVKGMRLDLTMERSLGTFPGQAFQSMLYMTELIQISEIFENIVEFAAGAAEPVWSRVFETLVVDKHALGNLGIDRPEDKEAAAAEAFHEVRQLLQRTRTGDRVADKQLRDCFYIAASTLPGGTQSAAHLLVKNSKYSCDRSLWVSQDQQHICLAPHRLENGDIAVILFAGNWINYLRPVGRDKFELIGWGYIAGFMDGEPFEYNWEDKVETFRII